jgi:peptidoglycan/LPS O-acetylase OafA/YrhL
MDSSSSPPPAKSTQRRRYWLRTVAAAVFAVFVSGAVSAIGRSQLWPHPESIAFAVFLFLIPILQATADRRRVKNWPLRLAASVVVGVIGGVVYALFIES